MAKSITEKTGARAVLEQHVEESTGKLGQSDTQLQDIAVFTAADHQIHFQAGLLDAMGHAVVASDRMGRITYWNQAATALYGWAAQEVLGRDAEEVTLAPQTREQARTLRAGLSGGQSWTGELLAQRRDSSPFLALVTVAPLYDDTGAVSGAIGVASDITARKAAEQAIRQLNAELEQRVVERTSQLDATIGELHTEVAERRRAEQTLRKNEHVQRILAEVALLPTSTLDIEELLARLCEVAEAAFDVTAVLIYLREASGALRLAGASSPALPLGLVLPLDTPRRAVTQAVQERRTVACELLARAPSAPLRDTTEVFSAAHWEIAAPLLVGGEVEGAVALLGSNADYVSSTDLDHVTQLAHIIGTALYQVHLYRQEHAVAERLRQLERWRASLLRVIAHEVRTPLGQIIGFADLVSRDAQQLSERGQRFLGHLRTAAAHLDRLVQRSFDLMRLSGEDVLLARTPVDLGQLVNSAVSAWHPQVQAKDATVACTGTRAQVMVLGDVQRLRQVLDVLLGNAVRFTPAEGRITVDLVVRGAQVLVQVGDSGPGVPAEMQEAIFRTGQAEDALTRHHDGLGLSLTLARRISELHGGSLTLAPADQGACFVLALPRSSAEQLAKGGGENADM